MKITVVGTGYVGLVTGTCLAEAGNDVLCIDIDALKVQRMQKGDVPATWADTSLLNNLTDYAPQTNFKDGIARFIEWYREYYNV